MVTSEARKATSTPIGQFRARWALAAGAGLGLLVLAATVLASVLHLRQHIRAQIASRDGEILDAVAAAQYLDDKTSGDTLTPLSDPGEQLQLVLKISRLRNVLGVRLFSPDGKFVNAVPANITEATLSAADLAELSALKPVSHFLKAGHLAEQDLLAGSDAPAAALLLVNIPLHEDGDTHLAGVAQFLMNGSSIAREYAALDWHLAWQSAVVFALGGTVLVAGLMLAFQRVQRANRALAERTSSLLQANRELALAAKTSAVGAVTSHLIHGLRNPLSGLQSFVQDHAQAQGNGSESDWQLAFATTRRMEELINRVVRVLQTEPTATYELSVAELAEALSVKLGPAVRAAGVRFESVVGAGGTLANREADLILLILENLLQNALEATPAGKAIRLTIAAENDGVCFEVQDEGPGLPAEVAVRLFTPCTSAKKGGSGIGLAISQQLAKHLGAKLELRQSSSQGCSFRLCLPGLQNAAKAQRREDRGADDPKESPRCSRLSG